MPRLMNKPDEPPEVTSPSPNGELSGEESTPSRGREKSRIMYIEDKSEGLSGPARIGRVTYSKTGKTLKYGGQMFRSLKGSGFKSNYFDTETGRSYWISGPRKDGQDRLYGERVAVEIDDDVAEEYWRDIRGGRPTGR
jgi:hypothetical protein